jgi:hypothetical protein
MLQNVDFCMDRMCSGFLIESTGENIAVNFPVSKFQAKQASKNVLLKQGLVVKFCSFLISSCNTLHK